MKRSICQILVILSLAGLIGCEWEWGGDDADWDDSWNWINFSATYRGTGGNLVRNFTTSGSGDTGDDGSGNTSEGTIVVINGEDGGRYEHSQAQLTGTLTHHPGIQPGSVTMVFEGSQSTVGTFLDANGSLSGTYSSDAVAKPDMLGSGTIDYDTGKWTLNLEAGGFFENTQLLVDYTYIESTNAVVVDEGGDDDDGSGGVDSVYSFTVTQTGNQIYITDSNGDVYEGTAWAGAFPGGDETGETSGAVTMNFSVSGGDGVTITGTFSGQWEAPAGDDEDDTSQGNLSSRIIDGTWSGDDGTADVRGGATSD